MKFFYLFFFLIQSGSGIFANPLTLWYEQPAEEWIEALPLGNGSLGAMVFGGIEQERIQLNEESLWSGAKFDRERPDAHRYLAQVRNLLFRGEYRKAQQMVREHMMGMRLSMGVHTYQTLGDLLLEFSHPGEISEYRRELDLSTATAQVSYKAGDTRYTRTLFSSYPDQVLAVHLTCDKAGALNFSVRLSRKRDADIEITGKNEIHLTGIAIGKHNSGFSGVHFAAQLRIKQQGGSILQDGDSLVIRNADKAVLYLSAATDYRQANTQRQCDQRLADIKEKTCADLKQRHITDYQTLFNRVILDLGEEKRMPTDERLKAVQNGALDPHLIALYFQYGRYLLISSSRPGSLPSNLQGIWAEDMQPPWNADYHININLQMNYWPAEVTHLSECHQPLFEFIDQLRPAGRETAANLYNCRGFVAHHTTDVWHWTSPIGNPQYGMWPMGGAWLCLHLWEHYAFTQDTVFLKNTAYPIMKEAGLFFTDYLVRHPQTGYLVSGPSSSPENMFYTPDGGTANLVMGPAMDHQIIRELLTHTLNTAQLLQIDHDFQNQLEHILSKLQPTEIGSDGRIMEWSQQFTEAWPGHRHISHLFALHPGQQISYSRTPELAEAARRTIDYRLQHGGGHTGWSRAWIINFFARLLDGEKAHANILALLRQSTLPNLFDTHPPFQIDGNFGGTAGIAEMLVQSHAGEIHILPALPQAWDQGSVSGLKTRGNHEIHISWRYGKLDHAEIKAGRPGMMRIRTTEPVKVSADQKTNIKRPAHNVVEIEAEPGMIVHLNP